MADAPKKGSRTPVARPAVKTAPVSAAKAASARTVSPKPVTPRPAADGPESTAKAVGKAPARAVPAPAKPAAAKPEPLPAAVVEPAPVEPVALVAPASEPAALVSEDAVEEVTKDAVEVAPVTDDIPPEPEVSAAVSGGTEAEVVKKEPALETEPEPVAAQAQGISMMSDVLETGKQFAADAKTKFESAFAELNEKAKVGVEKSQKAIEELSEITKGNVEAFVESGKIAAKGVETLGQDAAEYSRKSFEKATATMKSFASVKTPAEFFQLQSELLSSTFDAFAKETAKNSEAVLKLVGDVAQPISTRVSVVTEKVKALAA